VASSTTTPKHGRLSVTKNHQNMAVERTNPCHFPVCSFFMAFFLSFSLFIGHCEGGSALGNPLQFLDKTFERQN